MLEKERCIVGFCQGSSLTEYNEVEDAVVVEEEERSEARCYLCASWV